MASKPQSTPPLLRLPGEIRNQVYYFVFSGWTLRPMLYVDGSFEMAAIDPRNPTKLSARMIRDYEHIHAPMQTCRQMYAETRFLLYKHSKYDLRWCLAFTKWLDVVEDELRTVVWESLTESEKTEVNAERVRNSLVNA